ncbi:hypothetical protein QF045_002533 [Pseudomonas sp. W4I3]|nr:hypothetical protein [Pseudomonas sp. W4I3]
MFDPITVGAFCFAFLAIGNSLGVLQFRYLNKKA